jgi:hypothetical protein
MLLRTNAIQAGWHFDQDDAIIDNSFLESNSSLNCQGNLTKNALEPSSRKIMEKTNNRSISNKNTDEEDWTTTTPGRTKPKNSTKVASSTESIITTIKGHFEKFEAGTPTKISVHSPSRRHKWHVPDGSVRVVLSL